LVDGYEQSRPCEYHGEEDHQQHAHHHDAPKHATHAPADAAEESDGFSRRSTPTRRWVAYYAFPALEGRVAVLHRNRSTVAYNRIGRGNHDRNEL
jgi:hypothetical protein